MRTLKPNEYITIWICPLERLPAGSICGQEHCWCPIRKWDINLFQLAGIQAEIILLHSMPLVSFATYLHLFWWIQFSYLKITNQSRYESLATEQKGTEKVHGLSSNCLCLSTSAMVIDKKSLEKNWWIKAPMEKRGRDTGFHEIKKKLMFIITD